MLNGAATRRRGPPLLVSTGSLKTVPSGQGRMLGTRLLGSAVSAALEQMVVFAGSTRLPTSIVVYTGGCWGDHINICPAHLMKGGTPSGAKDSPPSHAFRAPSLNSSLLTGTLSSSSASHQQYPDGAVRGGNPLHHLSQAQYIPNCCELLSSCSFRREPISLM